jgi:hypothetical protein
MPTRKQRFEKEAAAVWCGADAELVINSDGAINQLEGGIIMRRAGR